MRAIQRGAGKEGRAAIVQSIAELGEFLAISAACQVLGVPKASYYRAIAKPAVSTATSEPAALEPEAVVTDASESPAVHYRALKLAEEQKVLAVLHGERFIDRAPQEVYFTLLDEGVYLGSVRTYYRILAKHQEVKERRAQRRHPEYKRPELLATGPNQVWTWDITKLRGPAKWLYYYLYVIIDIYSRYVVGWMLAEREAGCWAQQLIEETYNKQEIQPGQLIIHSDNGSPMKATPTVSLHARLDIGKSYSRPHVSNDNPFSESQFKTMKYSPGFPARFEAGFEEASEFCTGFFPWYNKDHRHSGIEFLTPEMVHYGLADQALAERHVRLLEAYHAHPERFVKGPPKLRTLNRAVYINPPRA